MDMTDYETGKNYYIISEKWYNQWSFYYQGSTNFLSTFDYKSTKLIKSGKLSNRRKKSRNQSNIAANSNRDISLDDMWLA